MLTRGNTLPEIERKDMGFDEHSMLSSSFTTSSSIPIPSLSEKKKKNIKSRLRHNAPKNKALKRSSTMIDFSDDRPLFLSSHTLSILLDFLRLHNATVIEGLLRVGSSSEHVSQLYNSLRSASRSLSLCLSLPIVPNQTET